jgi:hypothetical protein
MPGVVINGKAEAVPGLACSSWLDDPTLRLKAGEDCRRRFTRWIRGIVLHTTKGIPGGRDQRAQEIRPGLGAPVGAGLRTARFWSGDGRNAGAHLVVDFDGSVACLADLQTEAAYHAGEVNEVTIGIEIYQGGAAELYAGQLDVVVALLDWLTARFGIQRQMPLAGKRDLVRRIAVGAKDVVGIYGHRHVTTNRGPGDPGDAVFERLARAGYEAFDFDEGEDLARWKRRQEELGLDPEHCDGIPGPGTTALLRAAGHPHGLVVARPALSVSSPFVS